MADHYDILIVGAGHGGAQAAIALRQRQFAGTIAIVGEEPDIPYERPPLSKEYLAGDKIFERLLIRPAAFWADRDIAMMTSTRVVSVDASSHMLTTGDGQTIRYGELIWAAGGHARRLACCGHDLADVYSVRNRADVDRLTSKLPTTSRICVIGGGYIGLETAAVLSRLGKKVTVVEAADRVLARVSGEVLSRFYENEHRAHGVDFRLSTQVGCIEGTRGQVTGVRLADGGLIPCEMAIVGIGIVPAVQPLIEAGALGGNGVAVDEHCHTSLSDVWAIGDCAMHANAFANGLPIRLESVQNASEMATTVAGAITGTSKPYNVVPWFWSNQYDLRMQTVGLSAGHDNAIVRGDTTDRSFSVIYLRQGRVIALDCVNMVRDIAQGRRLVNDRVIVDDAKIINTTISLSDIR